jgi:hypothetical protein
MSYVQKSSLTRLRWFGKVRCQKSEQSPVASEALVEDT